MKKLLLILSLAAFLFGCANPEQTTFVGIDAAGTVVNAAIGTYNQYRKTHTVPTEQILTVRKMDIIYLDAVESARKAVSAYKTGKGTKADADLAIDALSAAAADLSAMIDTLTK